MKKSTLIFCLTLMASFAAICQRPESPRDLPDERARARIDAARAAFLTERLDLTADQAQRFWPVYNEFNKKRHELRKTFMDAQRKIGGKDQIPAASPEEQRKLVELGMNLRQQELDLEKQYSGKFMEVLSADQMLRLHPAERDFQQMVMQHLRDRKEGGHKKGQHRPR